MTDRHDMDRVLAGVDASRRVGWGKYFTTRDERDTQIRLKQNAHQHLARLAVAIADNEPLKVLEPNGELILLAIRAIAWLRTSSHGRAAIDSVLDSTGADIGFVAPQQTFQHQSSAPWATIKLGNVDQAAKQMTAHYTPEALIQSLRVILKGES